MVNDSLSAICSFQAIPEATITWLGPSDGRHDDMALQTILNAPYNCHTEALFKAAEIL